MRTQNVILADDDVAMRRWMRAVLGRLDVSIREAGSGWEVLALLSEVDADLVISDVRMPMPDGLHSLAMARYAGVEVPFLLITAFGGDALRASASVWGAAVLDKPFSAADLLAHVRDLGGVNDRPIPMDRPSQSPRSRT